VGARERVVLIEVENTRLLLGVAPGHVRTLHRLPLDERAFRHALNLAQEEVKAHEKSKAKEESKVKEESKAQEESKSKPDAET
jgi:flagellar biogenesis protein FliO